MATSLKTVRQGLRLKLRSLRRDLTPLAMRCGLTSKRAIATVDDAVRPLKERPLFCLCSGMLAGILIGTSFPFTLLHIIAILILCGTVTVRWPFHRLQSCGRLFVVGLLVSHLHVLWQLQALPLNHIARFVNANPIQSITVEGQLYRPVEQLGTRQRLYLRLHRLCAKGQWQVVRGQIRLNLYAEDTPFLPGDVLRIRQLRLYPVRGFLNPGAFDFKSHMHRRRIYAVGGISRLGRVQLLHRPQRASLQTLLEGWRRTLRTSLQQSLAPPIYNTFMAMILGQRGTLPPQQLEAFRVSGTAHLLVVSGLHIGFVASMFFLSWRMLFRRLVPYLPLSWRPTPLAMIFSLPGIMVYGCVVGWNVSTIRAVVMVGSSLLALAIGRWRELSYALTLAATLLFIMEPFIIFSTGFQLSFAAVAGIALALHSPYCQGTPTPPSHPWRGRVRSYLLISLAAYLGTAPILANGFHTIPSYGLLANFVLVPLAGLVVPYSLLFLLIIAVAPQFVMMFSWPLDVLLTVMLKLSTFIASLPGAQFHLAAPSPMMLFGYYGSLGMLFLPMNWRRRLLGGGFCLFILLSATGLQYYSTRHAQLRITFLDVGSGDAILVQIPGGHNLLIDGGGTYDGRFDIGAQVIAPVLWDQHITRLTLMAMTHPQSNHARGLVSIMRLFPTAHLITNGSPLQAPYLRRLLFLGQKWGTQHHTPDSGPRRWQWGQLSLTLLAPPAPSEPAHSAWRPTTENDKSLVLRLQYGSVSVLLTGDIQKSTEQWLVKHRDVQATILQIPHHGSNTSSSVDFLRHVRPQVAVISPGANNRYGHPHARVLGDLNTHNIRVYRTDTHGAITITTDGKHYHIMPLYPSRS